jgi:hypothetical protein
MLTDPKKKTVTSNYKKQKSYKPFGQQIIDINKELADVLKQSNIIYRSFVRFNTLPKLRG